MPFKRGEIEGLNKLLRDLNRAPAELKGQLRDAATAVADPVASDARNRARRASRQLAATAPTIKAKRDRIPSIQAGGATRVTSSGARAFEIFWGANFGSNRLSRFPARASEGRTIYPAIAAASDLIADEYLDAVQEVFRGRS